MKNFDRTFSPTAYIVGAFAFLAVVPQVASAQAVRTYLGSGNGVQSGTFVPTPNQVPQTMRSGTVFMRSGGSFGMSPGYNQPSYNQPSYNQPNFNRPGFNSPNDSGRNFSPPTYNNGYSYNNVPVYGNGLGYRNGLGYSNVPGFRNEQSSGPVVTVPNAFEGTENGSARGLRPGRFGGSASGGSGLSGYPFGTRNGGSDTENFRPIRPVGPAYGYSRNGHSGGTDLRTTTPPTVYQNNYLYNNGNVTRRGISVNTPPLLGGYYYGNYCDNSVQSLTYPSIYSVYDGFPPYIFNTTPNVIIVGQPVYQPYVTSYLPFDTPNYPVTYNQNNYYVASESRAQEIEGGGAPAQAALKNAYPADSYQAAFADIARAWTDGNIAPLRKHIRDSDTRISVSLNKKYSYSIASGDFVQITRDVLDRLHTVSFDFTRLRKAKTGDVTAYGVHVYRTSDSQSSPEGGMVPFDQSGTDAGGTDSETNAPNDQADGSAVGVEKTVYVSYTLRHRDGQWYITEIDSSDHDLVLAQ